jgi:hypothetical protein
MFEEGEQPRTASKGGAQDSDYIWEAEERSTRPYMRFSWEDRETISRKFQRLTKNNGLHNVERLVPSEAEKETVLA